MPGVSNFETARLPKKAHPARRREPLLEGARMSIKKATVTAVVATLAIGWVSACSDNGASPLQLQPGIPQFSSGVSAGGVTPQFLAGNLSGNAAQVCAALQALYDPSGPTWLPGLKVDPPVNSSFAGFTFTVQADGKHLNWSSSGNLMKAVLVKGGPNQYVYLYNPPSLSSDQNLHSPPVGSGNTPDISHYTFCYVPATTTSEGCSPGYWKNHTNSWAGSGLLPGQTVASVFGNAAGTNVGNVSLVNALGLGGGSGADGGRQILARAAVAALINASHPDVFYPLSAAQVIAQVNAVIGGSNRNAMLALASTLDGLNNLGCPINAHGQRQ
jgi:hypothetical protein